MAQAPPRGCTFALGHDLVCGPTSGVPRALAALTSLSQIPQKQKGGFPNFGDMLKVKPPPDKPKRGGKKRATRRDHSG